MGIVGFNFTKVEAEKKANAKGKVNINNNIMLTEAKEVDVSIASKGKKGLLLKFNYICSYEPKIGKVSLEGEVITLEEDKLIKKSIESWNKNKTVDPELTQRIMSHILNKSTVQAIILSRDIGLPAPIPLPKVKGQDKKQENKK